MMNKQMPPVVPVKLIMGILTSHKNKLDAVLPVLEEHFGPIDFASEPVLFSVTDYYDQEMGSPIHRCFLSFRELFDPSKLASIKHKTAEIENNFRINGNRTINIDPGYMDFYKVVLASFKVGGCKIYLEKGVYADMTLYYSKGRFTHFDWGFPDFKRGTYNSIFLKIRTLYKKNIKSSPAPSSKADGEPIGS